MSKKYKTVSVAALAICVLSASAAYADNIDTINLTLVYLGSTTTNGSNASNLPNGKSINQAAGNINVQNFGTPDGIFNATTAGLTQMDLTSPSVQVTPNLKNYFGVYENYHGTSGDALYGVGFNVVTTSQFAPVSSTGVTGGTINKWITFNPVDTTSNNQVWSNAGIQQVAFNGTVQNIAAYQTSSDAAYASNSGTPNATGTVASGQEGSGFDSTRGGTLLGVFAVQFTGLLTTTQTMTLQYGGPGDFQYYTPTSLARTKTVGGQTVPDPGATSNDAGYNGGSFSVVVTSTPEPASLGVLALGGMALLARRRKTA